MTLNTATVSDAVLDPTEFASHEVNAKMTGDEKIRILRDMIRIRRFEETAGKYYHDGKMGGFLHRYDGQESIAVGHASLLGENDHMITTYRCHAHALAVGMSMNECMAELYGKATGCSKGKGGSMHFFDPEKRYWGGHGIVGGQTPLGLGLAFYQKYWNKTGSCFCYMGDGAVNQGAFHESLNLAGLFNIPVIYVIENNGYSMGTSQCRSSVYSKNLASRAEGYDIEWDVINGWNVYEVRAKTLIALERAHQESRPTMLEIMTYRHYGHSVADAKHKVYRTEEEIERYKNSFDPIRLWKETLIAEGVISEEEYNVIDREAKQEAAAAADFADASPYPEFEDITKDVYWEVDHNTAAGTTGKHFFND